MTDKLYLDKNFSTTQLLIKKKPAIENHLEDKLDSVLFLPENSERKGEGGLRTKGYFKKSYEDKPLISIVTVVYNGEKYLEQTIKSVIGQSYDNVEYIIIDGGSTDGTLDIIKKYENWIDYWASEKDSGIYDAMNKGTDVATGEYMAFLNADDWYERDTLTVISDNILEHKRDYFFGNIDVYKNEKYQSTWLPKPQKYKRAMPIYHPGLFVKTEFLKANKFDTSYKIVSDYEFIIKLILKKKTYVHIPKTLTCFRDGGISNTQNTLKDKECFRLQYKHFGLFYASLGYIIGTKKFPISNIIQFFIFTRRKFFIPISEYMHELK